MVTSQRNKEFKLDNWELKSNQIKKHDQKVKYNITFYFQKDKIKRSKLRNEEHMSVSNIKISNPILYFIFHQNHASRVEI